MSSKQLKSYMANGYFLIYAYIVIISLEHPIVLKETRIINRTGRNLLILQLWLQNNI